MTRVLHVIDATTDESSLQALALLIDRSPAGGMTHVVCALDGATAKRSRSILGHTAEATPLRGIRGVVWSPAMKGVAERHGAEVAHAWGPEASRAAAVVLRKTPAVMTMNRPGDAAEAARWSRSTDGAIRFVVGSQAARAMLARHGVKPDHVAVVRPGVDFGAINAARSARTSRSTDEIRALLTGPASRAGGEYFGLWATAIVGQIHRGLRVVLPYGGREHARLTRFMRQIGMSWLLLQDAPGATWAELVAGVDFMVAPAVDEIATEPIAWAMAAGVPIVATAVRSVAELLADKHNALLCKPGDPRALASRILTAMEDRELCRKLTETARAQAYELFGVRDFVDHHARVYQNVLSGKATGEGVADTAVAWSG